MEQLTAINLYSAKRGKSEGSIACIGKKTSSFGFIEAVHKCVRNKSMECGVQKYLSKNTFYT